MKKWIIILFILAIVGGIGGIEALHYSSEPEFCAKCHPKHKPGPNGEVFTWEHSAHAKADVKCLDCHAKPGVINYFIKKIMASKDLYTQLTHSKQDIEKKLAHPSLHAAPEESCLFCHTTEFNQKYRKNNFMTLPTEFLKFRKLDYVKNPEFLNKNFLSDIMTADEINGIAFSHKDHIDEYKLRCVQCHFNEPAHPDFSKNYKLMMKKVCFDCHEKKDGPDKNDCNTCHTIQSKIREGKISNFEGEEDVMASLKCVECHQSFDKAPDKQSCIDCHDGDSEYGDTFIEWRTAYNTKINKVKLLYEIARAKTKENSSKMKDFKEIEKLYKIIINDGSKGIHNNDFIITLLNKLEGKLKNFNK